MVTPPIRPPRCRQRFNILIVTALTIVIASLLVLSPPTSANVIDSRQCVEIKEDYDLRNLARDHNVFLIVHETGEESSSAVRQHICNKLEATPKERLTDAADKGKGGRATVFAYMEIKESSYDENGELQDGGKNFARTSLGAKNFPSILFLSGGMHRASKYSDYITHYTAGSGDALDITDVEKFMYKHTGFYLGNDVYNIIFFDIIASRFMSYGDASGLDRLKQRGLALLVRFSTLFSFKDPFLSIGKMYNRAFSMSFENGVGYCKEQVKKLEQKLDASKDNLSQSKLHELQQKLAILKSFAEPRELTAEDNRQIFIHAMLHIGLLVATILLFVLPGDSSEDGGEGTEEEAINAIPVIAKVVDEDDKRTKKKFK